jgi:NADPH:quinone reductase-like Zn-dependent oxidoreductase
MSRLVLTSFGNPADSVRLQSTGDQRPGSGELLVQMEAATINDSDFLLIQGQYPVRPDLPSPVGAEGVGRVQAVGSGADQSLVGKRVIVLPTYEQGTWAERIVTRAENVLPVSDDSDPLQLAMVGINPATAHVLLRRFATLSPGDWVGQTAANSAVGLCVIALAKQFGLNTLNVVRRDSAADIVHATGGDQVIVGTENLGDRISSVLGGAQLSLVLDATGGPVVAELAHALKFGGKVVSYAFVSGVPPTVSILDMIFNEVAHTGFWVINWLRDAPRAEVEATYRELVDLVTGGHLSVPVEATYPLEDYKSAFEHATAEERSGKVLFSFT